MRIDPREANAAYAYAWWLHGSTEAAIAAVVRAYGEVDVWQDGPSRAALLGAVRAGEAAETLSRDGEVVVLHDVLGIPLPQVGALVGMAPETLGEELARGRLLVEGGAPVEGAALARAAGLAVADPQAVALAHVDDDAAVLRRRLLEGRDRARRVAAVAPPADLVDLIARAVRHGGTSAAPGWSGPRRRRVAAVLAGVLLIVMVLVLTARRDHLVRRAVDDGGLQEVSEDEHIVGHMHVT